MAWIRTIEEKEAGGNLADIYHTVERKRGKVSNLMKVQSLHPEAMSAHMDLYLQVMFGKSHIKREVRELIAVVVSLTNHCGYCVSHHAEALNFYWKDPERIAQLLHDYTSVDLPKNILIILEYAMKLTLYPQSMDEGDVEALRQAGYSDDEILDITLIVSYFNFVNRLALGLGVESDGEERTGYRY